MVEQLTDEEMTLSKLFYAGIGNRYGVPQEVMTDIFNLAICLAPTMILRSGGAIGCDQQFEKGCDLVRGEKEILRAKDATETAMKCAAAHHPAWDKCSDYVQKLMGRNAQIILGRHLDQPVLFVVCYAVDEENGGTAVGLRIARAHGIPVYNMKNEDVWEAPLGLIPIKQDQLS